MATNIVQGVHRTTLRSQVVDGLRDAITEGRLAPGTRLVETELSAAFGVSRGPLREALRQLEQEGLVVPSESGRLSVRQLTPRDVRHIFAVRAALECLAVETVCVRSEQERQTVVDELLDALTHLEESEGEVTAQTQADLELHRRLCQLSGNDILLGQWQHLSAFAKATIRSAGLKQALENMAAARHKPIIDAIAAGDAAEARRIVTAHMLAAGERIANSMDDGPID